VAERKRKAAERLAAKPQQVVEARRKATESLRQRYGVQLHHKLGFRRRPIGRTHAAPTYALAVFNIHRGCSANMLMQHRSWRREVCWEKKPPRRRAARRKAADILTEEELSVRF
jgi:hypothetical protein